MSSEETALKTALRKAFAAKLSRDEAEKTYLTGEDAKTAFLSKTDAGLTYLEKTEASETYAEKSYADETFLKKADAAETYLTPSDADDKYLSKTDAKTNYLGIDAEAKRAASSLKAEQDGVGHVIAETYLSKNEASAAYLGINAKARSAGSADTAQVSEKSEKDASGNVITETYATKAENDAKVSRIGDRGIIAGFETLQSQSETATVSDDSNDALMSTDAIAIEVKNGTTGRFWTKTIGITNASATVTLDDQQRWVGGVAPTVVADSVLVCCWYGSFGLANYITGGFDPVDGTGDAGASDGSESTAATS